MSFPQQGGLACIGGCRAKRGCQITLAMSYSSHSAWAPRPPLQGHAFEARIYAENPENGFLPAGGRRVCSICGRSMQGLQPTSSQLVAGAWFSIFFQWLWAQVSRLVYSFSTARGGRNGAALFQTRPSRVPRRVLRWRVPPGAAFFQDAPLRVDSGVQEGDTVSAHGLHLQVPAPRSGTRWRRCAEWWEHGLHTACHPCPAHQAAFFSECTPRVLLPGIFARRWGCTTTP